MIESYMHQENANPPVDKAAISREILAAAFANGNRVAEERLKAVEAAKAANPNKQPFDIAELGRFYSLRDMSDSDQPDPAVVAEYERGYYLNHPETQTLEEYAQALQVSDANASN